MGIFLQTWFCRSCGLELCGRCQAELPEDLEAEESLSCPQTHSKTTLFPVSSFSEAELKDILQEMKLVTMSSCVADTGIPLKAMETDQSDSYPVRRVKAGNLTDEQLNHLLSSGEPFVLTDVLKPGSPAELLDFKTDLTHPCKTTYFDGTSWCYKESTLEEYFQTWGSQHKVRIITAT